MPNKCKAKPRTVDRWNWNSHKFADAAVIFRYVRCSFGVFVFYFDGTHKQRPANFVWIKRICCSRSQLYLDYLNRFLAFFRLYVFFLHFFIARNEFFTLFDYLWIIFECGRRAEADISVGPGASPFFVASLLFALFSCLNLF